jgi:hypothetical protein
VPGSPVTCQLDFGCHVGALIFGEPMKSGLGGPCKAEGYSSIVLVPRTTNGRATFVYPHYVSCLVVYTRTSPCLHQSSTVTKICTTATFRNKNIFGFVAMIYSFVWCLFWTDCLSECKWDRLNGIDSFRVQPVSFSG